MSLDRVFDVAIIGGGLKGVAIARDCAMRRLSVALFEKDDLGCGGAAAHAGLMHGGPPPLEPGGETTRESCAEIYTLRRIAPNLFTRVPILIPALATEPRTSLDRVETWLSHYRRRSALKGGMPPVRLGGADVQALDPGFSAEIAGAVAFDEWAVNPYRLTVLTALSAAAAGAEIVLGARVDAIEAQDGKVVGVSVSGTGPARRLVRARTVVNVAGPWAAGIDPLKMPSLKLRATKSAFLVLDRRSLNVAILCEGIDGETGTLCLPLEDTTVIGPVHSDYYGNLDDVRVSPDDVGYLLQSVQRFFPRITDYRVMHTFAGVRALSPSWGTEAASAARTHVIYDHAADGTDGLYSMIGGKLATHRLMAEQITDLVSRKLKSRDECRTHLESLPGCTIDLPWKEESRRTGIDPLTVRRIMGRHGYKAIPILEAAQKSPELCRTVCECQGIIASEIEYCVREEWARTPADIARRTGLGRGPCEGCRCAAGTSMLLGSLLGWPEERVRDEAGSFAKARRRASALVAYGEQAKQLEYARHLARLAEGEREWPSP